MVPQQGEDKNSLEKDEGKSQSSRHAEGLEAPSLYIMNTKDPRMNITPPKGTDKLIINYLMGSTISKHKTVFVGGLVWGM